MPYLCMRHDFRAPAFGPASTRGDLRGRARAVRVGRRATASTSLVLSEHHGIDDGWLPAPLTMAGVVLGAHRAGPA